MLCYHVSDLHGRIDRYNKLFQQIAVEKPDAVFIGGDIFAHSGFGIMPGGGELYHQDFLNDFIANQLFQLRESMGRFDYPSVFIILGNDDPRMEEASVLDIAGQGLWQYVHDRRVQWRQYDIYGYAIVPPSPFLRKDWEKYDVSRYVDPGCISPEDGKRSVPVNQDSIRYGTIKQDLDSLAGDEDLSKAIFLFHTPPYKTKLDRAALDGKMIDYVPLDVHVGSIAVQRFIRARQPLLTLHGHVHESTRLTGQWRDMIGQTHMFNASCDGDELCIVRFDPEILDQANRLML